MLEPVTRAFNPRGVLPEEYLIKYPELNDYNETKKLKGVELQWCWYYGAKQSPFVTKRDEDGNTLTHIQKCQAVTALIFDNVFKNRFYEDKTIAELREGNIPNGWTQAIDFFRRCDTDARSISKSLIDTIFEQYSSIIEGGPEAFKDKNGDIDYAKYSSTTKMIMKELPELIQKKERGFSITESFVDEDAELTEGSYWNEMYLKSK